MKWVLVIVLSAICYGIIFYTNASRKKTLKAENKIIDREAVFYKREYFFETSVSSLKEIGDAIDKGILGSESISFEPNYERGSIIFHNNATFGTFGASLKAGENANGVYRYSFKIDAWREGDNGINRQDFFNANVLLTTVEKAFLSLDPQTKVSDQAAEITRKHTLF